MADDFAAKKADGAFLELLATPTTLLRVVLLHQSVEVRRQLDEVEGEVDGQQVQIV